MNRLLAQTLTLPGQAQISGPDGLMGGGEITIGSIISRAIPFIFIFAGIGLFLMILASGFDFLTSAGDSKKLDQGKQRLTYAIVGFIIIFASFWLVQILGEMFGLATGFQ
jgi:hypothetical protein